MARLEPTVARLIRPEWALRVPSPAHDLLTPADRRRYLTEHPDSFLTVTRGPEDVLPGGEWDSSWAVAESRRSLQRLLGAGAYDELGPSALYLYRLSVEGESGAHAQIGIVGNIAVDDYEQGVIRVHEQVHDARARHLADHLEGLRIQSSPIALAHRTDPGLSALVAEITARTVPVLDFVSPDGLRQQVWRVDDPVPVDQLRQALADAPLYLIDGHHRAAAAAEHRRRCPGPEADWMLSAIFPAVELRSQAFHRVLHHLDHGRLLADLNRAFPVRSDVGVGAVLARGPDELALLTGATWHLVDLGPREAGDDDNELAGLDTVRLERQILEPLLHLSTRVPGDRLTYRVGDPDGVELTAWRTGAGEALWLMRPVPIDLVLASADAGHVMPPKSTFFQPKARSGVFLRPHL
jgi:uncharacterized protein (DUF1015 family)